MLRFRHQPLYKRESGDSIHSDLIFLAAIIEKPPPCTVHYLSNNCKFGAQCRYGHDYVLEPKHHAEIKANAKKMPCPAVNKSKCCFFWPANSVLIPVPDQNCVWGDICCYGHVCPSGAKCYFSKKGKCKFVGGMLCLLPSGVAIPHLDWNSQYAWCKAGHCEYGDLMSMDQTLFLTFPALLARMRLVCCFLLRSFNAMTQDIKRFSCNIFLPEIWVYRVQRYLFLFQQYLLPHGKPLARAFLWPPNQWVDWRLFSACDYRSKCTASSSPSDFRFRAIPSSPDRRSQ